MSETREEQLARLKEWVLDRRKGADEFGPSDDWNLDTAALAAALHAFEVMPELLEACREAAIELALQDIADELWGTTEVQRKLEAAIAKAEGK